MVKYSKAEIEILEGYWGRLNEFEEELKRASHAELDEPRYQRMRIVVTGLKQLFPTLDDDLKTIIRMRYFDNEGAFEWSEIADELYYSTAKTLRKRTVILNKTAQVIGWV